MPRKLSPEEATVMIIRRRLQQMEEDKMAHLESEDHQDESGDQGGKAQRPDNEPAAD